MHQSSSLIERDFCMRKLERLFFILKIFKSKRLCKKQQTHIFFLLLINFDGFPPTIEYSGKSLHRTHPAAIIE